MKFIQHHSGSDGNLYEVISDSGKRLLIDTGVPWKKVRKALGNLHDIVGAIYSHSHSDHTKAIKDVMTAGIDCYASIGTLDELSLLDQRRTFLFGDFVMLSPFHIRCFKTIHDTSQPRGFLIECDGQNLLFCTDSSFIPYEFKRGGKRIKFDIIAIECNCCEDVLKYKVDNDEINEELAKRLLATHMSVQECKRYLTEDCDLSNCKELHLIHISSTNSDKQKIVDEFEEEFLIETFVCGD